MNNGVGVMEGRWGRATQMTPEADAAAAEERECLCRCRQGDERAFRDLMRRHRGRALYLAAQMLRDRTEAEDVVQEAFLRVFRALPTFRGDASFHSWLYRIIVNLCLDRGRRQSATPLPLEPDFETPAAPERWETRLHVEALLARLSDELRVTLLMREVVGLSYVEIAAELNLPVGTVRSRLHAAREQFRRMWLEEDVDPR